MSSNLKLLIRRIIIMAIAAVLLLLVVNAYSANKTVLFPNKTTGKTSGLEIPVSYAEVVIWYTDDNLKPYLEAAAREFSRTTPSNAAAIKVSIMDYIETINDINLDGRRVPDLFVSGSEALEKIYLSGLYVENTDFDIYNEENYPEVALNAANFHEKMLGYPLCYTSTVMVCNNNYADSIPKTFEEMIKFANSYVPDENSKVQNILRWNVKTLVDNYGFVGNYIDFGGPTGDDPSVINLNNDEAIQALIKYQNLHTFFSIKLKNANSDSIIDEFLKQKSIYAIIESNRMKDLWEADFPYTVGSVPDLTADIKTKPLSETSLVIVNPYTDNYDAAKEFAQMLTYDKSGEMYRDFGITGCAYTDYSTAPELEQAMIMYKKSEGLPKFRNTADYWLKLQNMLNSIWEGSDVMKGLEGLEKNFVELNTKADSK